MNKYIKITKNLLGNDIFDKLEKSEIFKMKSNTSLDPNEIKIALQIVPRAILSYLILNLKHLEDGGIADLELPFADGKLHVNKISKDVYCGDIAQNGKIITEFKYRSLPGIGLILLSQFELYDMMELNKVKEEAPEESKLSKLQEIIDERLRMNSLIRNVVDQKMSERDAIQQLINERLSEHFEEECEEECEEEHEESEEFHSDEIESIEILDDSGENIMESKKSKLKEFLNNQEKKRNESVKIDKNEISCEDCKTDLYKGGDCFKLCICFGQHFNKEIKIKKNEKGMKFKFPKSFDTDNVELLLNTIKKNK